MQEQLPLQDQYKSLITNTPMKLYKFFVFHESRLVRSVEKYQGNVVHLVMPWGGQGHLKSGP